MTVKYFSERMRRRRAQGTRTLLPIRLAELSRFLTDRYGETLPDDDAGRDDAFVMANLLARTKGQERTITQWLALRAPWLAPDEVVEITSAALRLHLKWTADKLAQRIGLDYATRTRLGIKTIGATDCDAEQRLAIRAQKDRDRKRAKRRDKCETPATVSLSKAKPWRSAGFSRSTWFARRRAARTARTAASAAYSSQYVADTSSPTPYVPTEEATS
jgi:hypothetical protein